MPFIPNTPEARVARADSKNPATTCRGITSSGRPCRRPVAAEADSRHFGGRRRADDPRDERLYCWQHREQARAASAPPVREARTSLDTLADRLGLLRVATARASRKARPTPPPPPQQARRPRPSTGTAFCCCFVLPVDDRPLPPARPKPQPSSSSPSSSSSSSHAGSAALAPIAPTTPPPTAAALRAELAKPLSAVDEPGYIYMFWLTPEARQAAPPAEAARSLLAPRPTDGRRRRASDVVASFAGAAPARTLLLKIGRANNVHRRLNEWSRQCGYNLSLLRYYPYVSGTADDDRGPRKLPHSHRVERLVHLELAGRGLRVADAAKCAACGREHREWFQVEATRQAVTEVDAVIRRWADWDEGGR